jgi:hypothetical protein
MSKDDEYRRQAADAERQARSARNDLDRASWLRIAQGWLSLLRKRPQSAEETFNQQVADKGTGQDDSKSSH